MEWLENTGLVVLNGSTSVTSGDAAITVTDAVTGALTITLKPNATKLLSPKKRLLYDVQMVVTGDVTTLTTGTANVSADVTRAV